MISLYEKYLKRMFNMVSVVFRRCIFWEYNIEGEKLIWLYEIITGCFNGNIFCGIGGKWIEKYR